MNADQIARAAVHACLTDLRERRGFDDLIKEIGKDWPAVERACVDRTTRAIEPLFPKIEQETLDFA